MLAGDVGYRLVATSQPAQRENRRKILVHFHVLVLSAEQPTEESIADHMAPHEESYNEVTQTGSGHWDWYRIGGRWDGVLFPDKEECAACAQNSIECHYSTKHEQLKENSRPVEELLEGIESRIAAVLTPDGKWLEGEKVWEHPEFKSFKEEGYKELNSRLEDEWRCNVRRILVEHNGCYATSVDIHS